ncbi:FxSxx-COOH system tetratricopeptide repeat protein [Actinophytocola sp.]|uniref:FxSxx-COOH system tetratricopeptide repeat protein n=1 Tax=Actinophytocola sp. TaxID=1872138 RepID=UPI002ED8A18E
MPEVPADRLGVDDLTWSEVADAVWLASATGASPRSVAEQEPPAAPRADASGTEPPPNRTHESDDANTAHSHPDEPDDRNSGHAEAPGHAVPPTAPPPAEAGEPAEEPVLRLVAGEHPGAPDGTLPIPHGLDLIRALRPLKRHVASPRSDDVVVDEVATAERAAQDGLWWPVTRRRKERWLDLTLVVDCGSSMVLWRSRIAAFVALVEQLGAFRAVQVRLLDTDRAADGVPLPPVLRGGAADAPPRHPAEILDHSGRRVVLVLTDGVGAAWRTDLVGPVLRQWGSVMPLSIVHLLPQSAWGSGGMAVHRARLSTPNDLKPNRRWTVELPDAWLEPDPAAALPDGAVPVPLLELGPRWLRWWSQLITGRHREAVDATVLLATDKPRPRVSAFDGIGGQSPRTRVNTFRSVASPEAQRLAQLLAAVPVSVPVAQLIQREFLPQAGVEVVAELLASGLLRYGPDADSASTSDARQFDIPAQVRESLLEGARRTETARVVRTAAHHFGRHIGALERLRAAIDDPHNTPDPELTPDTAAEVALERTVMRALSGPYSSRADRLTQLTMQPKAGPPVVDRPESDTTMPPRLERPDLSATGLAASTEQPPTASRIAAAQQDNPHALDAVTTPMAHPPVFTSGGLRERQPDEAPPIWGNVPQRNLSFTGRSELLDQLSKRLTAGGTTAVLPAALHGMGGIGKTQMAVEYIYRHLQDYEVIWWIEAARPTQIRAALTDLARQLHLPGGNDASVAIPAVREALRTGHPYRRWLLVFDAAESPDSVRPFFPTNGPGEILITSRNPDWAGVARPLEIALFKREESRELLRSRGPEIGDSAADQVAERLGDLPLAIAQAAAWLAETGMPAQEYLRLFDEKVHEILEASAPPDDEVSVTAAWNVSFDELRTRNPAAHQILQICAFFSPEPISRETFTGVRGVSILPEIDVALRDPIQLARAIRDINRYSLAKIDHGNNTLQLHRLVQLVLRTRLMPKQLQVQMQHGAHQLLATMDPNDPDSGRYWRLYRELLPHAYAADVVDCDDAWVRQLVVNLMRFLAQWGDFEEAAALGRQALERWTEALGESHPQTLEVAGRLGLFLWARGRFQEASELNQRTLQLRLQVSGENSEETLGVQTNVVIDYRSQGAFAEARKLSEEILRKSRKLFGEDDPVTLSAAYQHGLSLRLSGEYSAAADVDEDAFRRSVEVFGPDHPRAYIANTGRIIDRREAGAYSWARIEQEKLTGMWWERFGEDRADCWISLFQLAVARRKDGDHAGAVELSKRALDYFSSHSGDDDTTTMVCLLAYSIDLRHQGNLAEARKQGEEVFERYRRVLGEEHPHTIATTVDLAVTLRLLGDAAGARELDERALEQFRTLVGADNPFAIVAAINLASDHAALGDVQAALALNAEAVERARRVFGDEHPTTLAVTLNHSRDLRAVGRGDEAEALYSGLVARYRKTFGEAHPATAAAASGARADCDIDPIQL